jgi:hypothetical protein
MTKETKGSVDYTADAKNDNERCALCRFFIAVGGQCRRVAGAVSPKGWCELFERKETRMSKLSEMRARDSKAKLEKIYDSPGMKKLREQPKAYPMLVRHTEESSAMKSRHHDERRTMLHKHESGTNRLLISSKPLPGDHHKNQAQEYRELVEQQNEEAVKLDEQHLQERDAQRRAG